MMDELDNFEPVARIVVIGVKFIFFNTRTKSSAVPAISNTLPIAPAPMRRA